MKSRFLLTRRGCSFCNNMKKAVNRINVHLSVDKKINIIDCSDYEEFGVRNIFIMDIFNKMGLEEGYPFLYIDGIKIDPAPTPEQMRIILTKFLQEDFIF